MLALGAVLFLVGLAWFLVAVGWPLRNVVLLAVVLVGAALVVGSNWSSEAFIAVAAVALVWALGPRSKPPDDRLQPQPGGQAIVVMGDSFSSRQGASRSTTAPTPPRWADRQCRRAPTAFGPLLAEREIPADQLLFVACSGAKIRPPRRQRPISRGAGRAARPQTRAWPPDCPSWTTWIGCARRAGNRCGSRPSLSASAATTPASATWAAPALPRATAPRSASGSSTSYRGLEDRLVARYLRDHPGRARRGDPSGGRALPGADRPGLSDSNFTANEHRFLNGFAARARPDRGPRRPPGRRRGHDDDGGRLRPRRPRHLHGRVRPSGDATTWPRGRSVTSRTRSTPATGSTSLHPQRRGIGNGQPRRPGSPAASRAGGNRPPSPRGRLRRLEDLMGPDCSSTASGPTGGRCPPAATTRAGHGRRPRRWPPAAATFSPACSSSWAPGWDGVAVLLLWQRDGHRHAGLGRHRRRALERPGEGRAGAAAGGGRRRLPPRAGPCVGSPAGGCPSCTAATAVAGADPGRSPPPGTSCWAGPADRALQARLLALRNHSERTWRFGLALAHRDTVALDPEPFYLAAMAHDLGLAERILRPPGAEPFTACFTIAGARAAIDVAGRTGLAPAELRTGAVGDAIVNHITPGLSLTVDDPLAVYLQRASLLDLTGQRSRRLLPGELLDAASEQPRTFEVEPGRTLRTARVVTDVWGSERAAVPDGPGPPSTGAVCSASPSTTHRSPTASWRRPRPHRLRRLPRPPPPPPADPDPARPPPDGRPRRRTPRWAPAPSGKVTATSRSSDGCPPAGIRRSDGHCRLGVRRLERVSTFADPQRGARRATAVPARPRWARRSC